MTSSPSTPGQESRPGQPIGLGDLTVKNRLVATAHGIAAVVDGVPASGDAEYWARLSAEGAGMLVAGGTQVSRESTPRGRNLTEAYRPGGMRRRAAVMKSGGAAAVIQLGHLGQETLGAATFYPFVAASAVRSPREPTAHRVLGTEDVRGAAKVTVLIPAAGFAAGVPAEARLQLGERLPGNDLVVLPFHTAAGVVPDGRLSVRNLMAGTLAALPADLVVVVGERRAHPVPGRTRPMAVAVGDCVVPRRAGHAIAEGRQAAVDVLAALNEAQTVPT